MKYNELTSLVREQIIEGINNYGEFVQQQQEADQGLLPKDERDEEEKILAQQLAKQVCLFVCLFVVA